MSDTFRKDFSDKASEAVKPDSEKSYLDKAKETVTDKADKVGSKAQPEEEKSYLQQASDKVSSALGGDSK